MKPRQILLASCVAVLLGAGGAQAGPCNTANKDAGSGPTPGHTNQTVGTAASPRDEHPPTSRMNNASGDVATSSQDTQKQMQNQPTAAQQAQGAKSRTGAGNDC
ncbi:hypothetical protein [Bradyrhizobium lablabi]|uniref:hypothetical protein n=1 Tax=Bradyrhizobium lablabi TaxID=722472 RepID=UPI001BA5A283|nr:hypothetical protein [Bradyrhizobium lablabi]MBR0693407.1 hypothetical protein [Bradyrhizobium lablabi]